MCVGSCARVAGCSAPALRTGCTAVESWSGRSWPNCTSKRHVTSGKNHGVSSLICAVSSPRAGRPPTTRNSIDALTPIFRKPNSVNRIPASIPMTIA